MKRAFDLVLCFVGLLLLWPLLLAIGLSIIITDGTPVFFRQERVGLCGKRFRMWKFRTMVRDAQRLGTPLTVGRDPRITPVGHWLRKTKLDELPQLLNVMMGEMSFVGPRPEVPRFVDCYTVEQRRVLDIVPGITDPATIQFRHESDLLANSPHPEKTYLDQIMPQKIQLNLAYWDRSNVLSDFLVILKTLFVLVR